MWQKVAMISVISIPTDAGYKFVYTCLTYFIRFVLGNIILQRRLFEKMELVQAWGLLWIKKMYMYSISTE